MHTFRVVLSSGPVLIRASTASKARQAAKSAWGGTIISVERV